MPRLAKYKISLSLVYFSEIAPIPHFYPICSSLR
nr:MAG TPA: hypothetical protein [Inoviridae sp.]